MMPGIGGKLTDCPSDVGTEGIRKRSVEGPLGKLPVGVVLEDVGADLAGDNLEEKGVGLAESWHDGSTN